ncbi:MAG: hypothetical protein K0Q97_264 [Bacillota bacterium]|jgi:hypothetical protein|nr:hypothetical protein [Bacillota bacterium]
MLTAKTIIIIFIKFKIKKTNFSVIYVINIIITKIKIYLIQILINTKINFRKVNYEQNTF